MHRTAFVVEDDGLANASMQQFLRERQYTVTAAETRDAAAAILDGCVTGFDLAIFDIVLRGEGDYLATPRVPAGLELAQTLKRRFPSTALVLWTAYADLLSDIVALVLEGYRGIACVVKGGPTEVLADAITQACRGAVYIDPATVANPSMRPASVFLAALPPVVADRVASLSTRLPHLTPREREVVELLNQTTSEIARTLTLADQSVRKTLERACEHLGMNDEPELFEGLRRETLLVLATLLARLREA